MCDRSTFVDEIVSCIILFDFTLIHLSDESEVTCFHLYSKKEAMTLLLHFNLYHKRLCLEEAKYFLTNLIIIYQTCFVVKEECSPLVMK